VLDEDRGRDEVLFVHQSSTTRRAGGLRMPSRGGRCVKSPLKGNWPGKLLKKLLTRFSPSRGPSV
jgi:hypothetical protein